MTGLKVEECQEGIRWQISQGGEIALERDGARVSELERLNIRNVRAADVPACARIEVLCFPPEEGASEEKIRKRARIYPEGFLVAELGGEVVGFVNCGATGETDLSDEALKDMVGHDPEGENLAVFSVAVAPAHQRKGIAAELLRAFLERARELDKRAVLLLCKEHLVPYYERFGFVDAGPSASSHGGARWRAMRRDVDSRR